MTVVITLNLNDKTTILCNFYLSLYQPDTMTHSVTDKYLSERLCLRTAIESKNFISIFTSTSQNDIRIAHAKHNLFLFRVHIIQYGL